jgi:tetratricopeptide (TPR) repeat protein
LLFSTDRLSSSKKIAVGFVVAALVATGTVGCGSSKLSNNPDEVYSSAVRLSLADDHSESARAAFHYMKSTSADNERYDRAQKLLAENLEALGLRYAASLFYLDIAKSRRDVRLVDDAIRSLERLTSEDGYDQSTVLEGFLASAEITGLPPQETAFVAYHQGLDSMRHGLLDWATERFADIPESSPYRHHAEYALSVKVLAAYDLTKTEERLRAMLEADDVPKDLAVDVHRTLARIAFEQERYDDALDEYEEIRDTATDDPKLLLEMAWSHYYLGDYQRALGLLMALDAPTYSGLIAPERYLLEALSLKQLCQFEPARKAASRLRSRHGKAIDDLYAGVSLKRSDEIRKAARHRESGRPVAAFRRHMQREAAQFKEVRDQFGAKLADRIDEIYAHGLNEAKRREDEQLFDEMRAVSEELLNAEEGVRLVLHELAVSVLRGRQRDDKAPLRSQVEIPAGGDTVFYKFDGEFWTDEIDDLVVPLEDRCVE